jgi:hypothetical protein
MTSGPLFLGVKGGRMDRYAADRTVKCLARRAGITKIISPHSLRHFADTQLKMTPAYPCGMFKKRPATPTPVPPCAMTEAEDHSTVTPSTSSPPSWPAPADKRVTDAFDRAIRAVEQSTAPWSAQSTRHNGNADDGAQLHNIAPRFPIVRARSRRSVTVVDEIIVAVVPLSVNERQVDHP